MHTISRFVCMSNCQAGQCDFQYLYGTLREAAIHVGMSPNCCKLGMGVWEISIAAGMGAVQGRRDGLSRCISHQVHSNMRAQDRATTNCRTKWQSSKQLKPDTILDAWQKHFISLSQSDSLRLWQNAMADFCSYDFAVWEAPASLKWSIEVILCIELK